MARTGRPAEPYSRYHGLFIRFSDVEWGALVKALDSESPVRARKPSLSEWARDLLIGHASQVLAVDVTRATLKHQKGGVSDWKRWKLATAVRRAARRRRRRR